jgi:hypothetical protein
METELLSTLVLHNLYRFGFDVLNVTKKALHSFRKALAHMIIVWHHGRLGGSIAAIYHRLEVFVVDHGVGELIFSTKGQYPQQK